MDLVCGMLSAFAIVGAYEVAPGWMQVHQYNPETQSIITLGLETDEYLACLEGDFPVRSARSAD